PALNDEATPARLRGFDLGRESLRPVAASSNTTDVKWMERPGFGRCRGSESRAPGLEASCVLRIGLVLIAAFLSATAFSAEDFPVTITIEAGKLQGELRPIWRFFGYDEPNFTYMKDGKKLLTELSQLGPQTVFIR